MGLERAEARLFRSLRRQAPDSVEIRVVGGRGAYRTARRLQGRWVPSPPGRPLRNAWRRSDLVHLAGLDLPPPPRSIPFVATIHDLCALDFSDEGRLPASADDIARRARLILTPSAFTADQVHQHLGVPHTRLRVVPNGPGQDISSSTPPLSRVELEQLGLRAPFVLRYGGYTERKNVGLLLDAWPLVTREVRASLVLAGPPQGARTGIVRRAGRLDEVHVLDFVDAKTLPRLIRTAVAVVVPSVCEGFGLPLLEAMAAGTPVVALELPFAREICGDAGLLCDATAVDLAAGLHRVIIDRSLRVAMSRRGAARAALFSWQRAADLTLRSYREALDGPTGRHSSGA